MYYFLAFDHRRSFWRALYGEDAGARGRGLKEASDAKRVIFDGLLLAVERGMEAASLGVLVDEESGSQVALDARCHGLKAAIAVERSGQAEFQFEYGDQFSEHIERFDPDFIKALVRYNPASDPALNQRQLDRLVKLSDWLAANERKLMFELLVPATDEQLAAMGDSDRYDRELRPELTRRAMEEIQAAGIEATLWKLEGLESRADAELLAAQARAGSGRDDVACVVLGRGASLERVAHWFREAAGVTGFAGFAVGRSIWSEPVRGWFEQELSAQAASSQIADRFLELIEIYGAARTQAGVPPEGDQRGRIGTIDA